MAITIRAITPMPVTLEGNMVTWSATIDFDSSYVTNGMSVPTTKDVTAGTPFNIYGAIKKITRVSFENNKGYTFWYDRTNNKIKVFVAGIEVINGYDLSGLTGVYMTVEGFK